MSVDLKTVRKLSSLPPSSGALRNDDDRLVVVVRLKDGATQPTYIRTRAKMGSKILTGEIWGRDLKRIDSDPSIVSVSLSRPLPLIKTV